MSLEMPSGASVLFLVLAKDYNFDVVIKLIVILTHNLFSKFAILLGRYIHTLPHRIWPSQQHRALTTLILNDTYSWFSFMSRDC